MAQAKRATVYLEANLHRALRVKAAETDVSVSELINDAVRFRLAEDATAAKEIGDLPKAGCRRVVAKIQLLARDPRPREGLHEISRDVKSGSAFRSSRSVAK
jgi:hypothetical protein